MKETVVLPPWLSEMLTTEFYKLLKADRSDKGLALETSTFESLCVGQLIYSRQHLNERKLKFLLKKTIYEKLCFSEVWNSTLPEVKNSSNGS